MEKTSYSAASPVPYLKASLQLINCFWIPVAVFFLLQNVSVLGSLKLGPIASSFVGILFDHAIIFGLKVSFWTVFFGSIVDILAGAENTLTPGGMRESLKKGWWIGAAFVVAPWLLHFLTTIVFSGKQVFPFSFLKTLVSVVMAYWAAGQFVRIKYAGVLTYKIKDLKPSWSVLIAGIIFLVASPAMFFLSTAMTAFPFLRDLPWLLWLFITLVAFSTFVLYFLDTFPDTGEQLVLAKTLILVNPPYGGVLSPIFLSGFLGYPSFFLAIKAMTPRGYRVIEYNRNLWHKRYYRGNALVAIGTYTHNCSEAYNVAKEFRLRGAKVVMGGPHVSFFPDEALMFCDAVVIGSSEGAWEEVVRDYENGALKKVYQGSCSENDVERMHDYLMSESDEKAAAFVLASRGCKFHCYFCAIPSLSKEAHSSKAIEKVVELAKKVSSNGKQTVDFLDNNIYKDPVYAKELLRALVPLKIKWNGSVSIDVAKDEEMLRLMKDSGCKGLLIGFEIAPGSTESSRGGKLSMAHDYVALVRKIKQTGAQIKASFVFGFPGDTWMSFYRIWRFCMNISPEQAAISFLIPLPRSRFFDDVVREERLVNLNWRSFGVFSCVFDHPILRRTIWLKVFVPICCGIIILTASKVGRRLLIVALLQGIVCFFVFAGGAHF